MRSIAIICLSGSFVGFGIGAGCTRYLANHCANNEGSQSCVERGSGLFCNMCLADNDGCTNELPSENCLFVGHGSGTGETSDDSRGEISEATTSDVTSLDGEITAGETTLAASEGGDATTSVEPSCMSNDQCSGTTPICDAASGVCVACSEHAHCGEAACNFFTGSCLAARVIHVGPGQLYARLEDAVASFATETALEGTIIVHDNGISYHDTIVIDAGRTIAFLSFEDDLPAWDNDEGDTSPLTVDGKGATALLDGLVLMGGSEEVSSIRVTNGSRAWLDRSRTIDNSGGGVMVDDGAWVVLRNCFIDTSTISNALRVVGGAATVLYSTLAAGNLNGAALSCTNPVSVVVRNSIITAIADPSVPWGDAVDVDCSGATVDISYTATESFVPGIGNVSVGQMPYGNPDAWFVDYANEDFHLQNEGLVVFANIAQWQPGDPLTDIDGDPRPALDGTPDHAGADRP